MKDRIAIIEGLRTPFCKAGGVMRDIEADDLGAFIVRELLARIDIPTAKIDEVIIGNVLQPSHAANIARIISVKAGLSSKIPAYTVNRNCASGMEAIASGVDKILTGHDEIVVAGGVESMSHFPVLVNPRFKEFLMSLNKAKGWSQRFATLSTFRPSFLIPKFPEIADPLCGLSMGQTAEVLVRELRITRAEQDQFALLSHQKAAKAIAEGVFADEIAPIPVTAGYNVMQTQDDGVRVDQTIESLTKLKPIYDKQTGIITAGASSPLTDGAAVVLLMRESQAKSLGLKPLGFIRDYAEAGVQPNRMGLGPVYATAKLLTKTGMQISEFDLIEINEAFAAQVLAVAKAFGSDEFAKKELGLSKALGTVDLQKLNVNGGAIAVGHPLGASGTRIVITLLKELRRRGKHIGLATLCIGGGQGQAMIVETE